MAVDRKRVANKAKQCLDVGSLGPLYRPAVNKMVASRMKDAGARRFHQGRRKTALDGSRYRNVLPGDNVARCRVLKQLEGIGGEMLRRKTISDRVMRSEAQH